MRFRQLVRVRPSAITNVLQGSKNPFLRLRMPASIRYRIVIEGHGRR